MAKLRDHDRDAWMRFATLYGPVVYGWCRRRGLQADDAADILQEVFRAVALKIQDFASGPGSTFRGWLWTITRNKILDQHRRNQRRPEAAGRNEDQYSLNELPESLDDSDAELNTTANLVRRALEMIRPDFKEQTWQAFWRVAMDQQSVDEVAKSLGLTPNAVYIARSRVLRRLRDELGADFI